MKFNILQMTPDLNYVDGRSYYVYLLSKYLKENNHNVTVLTNGGDSLDRLQKLKIPVHVIPSLSSRKYLLKSRRSVSQFIKENKIDIIHTHHRYYELIANTLRKTQKVKTVLTALSIVDKRFFVEYKSDCLIAVSSSVKDMLAKKFKIDKRRIVQIPNFVDSSELKLNNNPDKKLTSEIKKEKNGVVIFSAGRFDPEKNFETLIRAVAKLKVINPKLILIGEGKDKFKYEKLIKSLSVNADIFPPKKNLKGFFEIADICVLSSVRDPLPGFMLQSGLFSKPFVGADVDGIKDTIISGFNGLLFKSRDENDLASKISQLIEDKSLQKKYASNLNKLVLKKFTEKSVIPQIEKLYDNLMK